MKYAPDGVFDVAVLVLAFRSMPVLGYALYVTDVLAGLLRKESPALRAAGTMAEATVRGLKSQVEKKKDSQEVVELVRQLEDESPRREDGAVCTWLYFYLEMKLQREKEQARRILGLPATPPRLVQNEFNLCTPVSAPRLLQSESNRFTPTSAPGLPATPLASNKRQRQSGGSGSRSQSAPPRPSWRGGGDGGDGPGGDGPGGCPPPALE
eukprot:Hpha_TRINITY_DN18666_c0_g1::TRINITY_DN18666_c0_g1_i1::g.115797::m.115797